MFLLLVSKETIMGIPKFFAKLHRKYKSIITTEEPLTNERHFRILYFDYNCLIHPAVQKAIESGRVSHEAIFKSIKEYTVRVIDFVGPRKVYICVDGVCPRAKMVQQRERRYKSVLTNRLKASVYNRHGLEVPEETFDRNAITPGTEFMEALNAELYSWTAEDLNVKELVVSGSDKPGEGEQKIMYLIRNNEIGTSLCHYIYGLDADLIMLAMTIGHGRVTLVREAMHFGNVVKNEFDEEQFCYLKIAELKDRLFDEFGIKSLDKQKVINDYVTFCFLMGNDFLPSVPSLHISDGALETLMDHYIRAVMKTKKHLCSKRGITLSTFKELVNSLAEGESQFFQKRHEREMKRPMNYKKEFDTDLERDLFNVTYVYGKQQDTLKYYQEGYHQRHYHYYFNWPYNGIDDGLRDICKEYLNMITWNFKYYFNAQGPSDWRIYYRYAGVPLISDLRDYLNETTEGLNAKFDKKKPFSPKEQLMLVLPKESLLKLVPEATEAVNGPLKELYPEHFVLDAIGKRFLWESKPFLPYYSEESLPDNI